MIQVVSQEASLCLSVYRREAQLISAHCSDALSSEAEC